MVRDSLKPESALLRYIRWCVWVGFFSAGLDGRCAARTTLRELLDWNSCQVCGDVQNGKEAIEKVIELKP
jgi:hypothetical protein